MLYACVINDISHLMHDAKDLARLIAELPGDPSKLTFRFESWTESSREIALMWIRGLSPSSDTSVKLFVFCEIIEHELKRVVGEHQAEASLVHPTAIEVILGQM